MTDPAGIEEAMDIIGVSRNMIYKMIAAGRLTRLPGPGREGRPGRNGPLFDRAQVQAVADLRRSKLGVDKQ